MEEKRQEKLKTSLPKPASWHPLNEQDESMPELEGWNMNYSRDTVWVHLMSAKILTYFSRDTKCGRRWSSIDSDDDPRQPSNLKNRS